MSDTDAEIARLQARVKELEARAHRLVELASQTSHDLAQDKCTLIKAVIELERRLDVKPAPAEEEK